MLGKGYSDIRNEGLMEYYLNLPIDNGNDGITYNIKGEEINIDELFYMYLDKLKSIIPDSNNRSTPTQVVISVPPYYDSLQLSILNSICLRLSIIYIL